MNFASPLPTLPVLLALILTVTGCSSVLPKMGPNGRFLVSVPSETALRIEKPFTFSKKLGTLISDDTVFEFSLQAGRYAAVYDDGKGNYFEGLGACLTKRRAEPAGSSSVVGVSKAESFRCGVFIPSASSPDLRASIYVYQPVGELAEETGIVNIQYLVPQPDAALLRAALSLK